MAEIDVQRRLTTYFINTMPVTVTLFPRLKVKQPAGGFKWIEQAPRAAQVMRLIEPSTIQQATAVPLVAADGVERRIEFTLLGEWDATIGLYDVFTHDGHEWEVAQLAQSNGWEQRASVVRRG